MTTECTYLTHGDFHVVAWRDGSNIPAGIVEQIEIDAAEFIKLRDAGKIPDSVNFFAQFIMSKSKGHLALDSPG